MEEALWFLLVDLTDISTNRDGRLATNYATAVGELGIRRYAELVYILGATVV